MIKAKLKAAALSSSIAWLWLILLSPVWVILWGDWDIYNTFRLYLQAFYTPLTRWFVLPLLLICAIIFTWRLLIAQLYIGFFRKTWLLGLAITFVFLLFLSCPFILIAMKNHPDSGRYFLRIPHWFPFILAVIFVVKLGFAYRLARISISKSWVTLGAVTIFIRWWFLLTGLIVFSFWFLFPIHGWMRWMGTELALFSIPILRMACAIFALGKSRQA